MREYVWLPDAGYAGTDLPLAVVDGVNTSNPALYHVHADHLSRPSRLTDAAKTTVWEANWMPWGARYQITGALDLDARFPGQWFQLESGLHYNWHRHYDPTLGRYTQADPLGFVDGPSVYGYAKGSPLQFVDPEGLRISGKAVRKIIEACLVAWQLLTGDSLTTRRPTRPPQPPISRPIPGDKPKKPPAAGGGEPNQ